MLIERQETNGKLREEERLFRRAALEYLTPIMGGVIGGVGLAVAGHPEGFALLTIGGVFIGSVLGMRRGQQLEDLWRRIMREEFLRQDLTPPPDLS